MHDVNENQGRGEPTEWTKADLFGLAFAAGVLLVWVCAIGWAAGHA